MDWSLTIQILLFTSWLVLFVWLVGRIPFFRNSGIRPHVIRLIFFVKLLSGIFLVQIYSHYYKDRETADIFKYYDDAQVIYRTLPEYPVKYLSLISGIDIPRHPTESVVREMKNWTPLSGPWLRFTQTADYNLFNSNRMITRINALLMPVSKDFIYTHVLFFCAFSLVGLMALFKMVRDIFAGREVIAFLLIFFLPSILLWCSAPLKDGLLLALVNLFFYYLFKLKKPESIKAGWRYGIMIFLFSGLILFTKYYVLLAAIPALIAFFWKRMVPSDIIPYIAVPAILLTALIMQAELNMNRPDVWEVLSNKREEALKLAVWADAGHQTFNDPVDPGIMPVLRKVPESIFNSLFRPMLFESGKPLMVLAALENTLVLFLLILFIYHCEKSRLQHEYFLFFLTYSLCLAFIIGFTTPVTGGLVRYKTAFIIYLLLAVLMAGNYSGFQQYRKYIFE